MTVTGINMLGSIVKALDKMYRLILLITLAAVCQTSLVSYEGYKVYQVTPRNVNQLKVLEWIRSSDKFDFWTETRMLNRPWTIMVEPSSVASFNALMLMNKFEYKEFIKNFGSVINNEVSVDLSKTGRISFDQYNRYDTVAAYVRNVAQTHSDIATLFSIGKSSEGRDILGLKISTGGSNKPAILVDCGIHAREWMASAMGQYLINQLVENSANANMIKNVDWYVIPLLNPDGYEYTHTHDRMWRKTRSRGTICYGTDANRNFGFHWNEVGASDDECSDIYAGPRAFSEPESDQLKNFALTIKNNAKLYLTFHSYGEMMLYPWGFTSDYPENADELQSLGEAANEAIKAVRGSDFEVGSSTNVLYPAAGGSDDWMKGVAGMPLAYTLELWGRNGGFQPPASEIKNVVGETFEGVKVFADYVGNKYA